MPALRGGSWINTTENARCAYRNRNHPDNSNNDVGLRVVLSMVHSMRAPAKGMGRRHRLQPAPRGLHGGPARWCSWPQRVAAPVRPNRLLKKPPTRHPQRQQELPVPGLRGVA